MERLGRPSTLVSETRILPCIFARLTHETTVPCSLPRSSLTGIAAHCCRRFTTWLLSQANRAIIPHRRARDAAHPTAHVAAAQTDLAALNLGAPIAATTTGPSSDATAVKPLEQARDVQEGGYQVEETPAIGTSGVAAGAVSSSPSEAVKETETVNKETDVKSAVPASDVKPAVPASTAAPVAESTPVVANGTAEKITATEKPAQTTQTAAAGATTTGKNTTAPKKKKGGLFAACCGKGNHIE